MPHGIDEFDEDKYEAERLVQQEYLKSDQGKRQVQEATSAVKASKREVRSTLSAKATTGLGGKDTVRRPGDGVKAVKPKPRKRGK